MDVEARSLSTDERAVLDLLLGPTVIGADELKAQAQNVLVTGRCDCGCPTVHLTPAAGAPRALLNERLWSVEGRVDAIDDTPGQDIILFLRDGRLDSLELVDYSPSVPDEWPPVSTIRLRGTP